MNFCGYCGSKLTQDGKCIACLEKIKCKYIAGSQCCTVYRLLAAQINCRCRNYIIIICICNFKRFCCDIGNYTSKTVSCRWIIMIICNCGLCACRPINSNNILNRIIICHTYNLKINRGYYLT